MKLLVRTIKIAAIAVATVVVLLLALTALYKERVVKIFIEEAGRRSDITITMSDTRLTLLRRFPKASVVMNNLLVASNSSFTGNDTLLAVNRASLDFSLTDLLRKNYTIERITLSGGLVNILTDNGGTPNYPVKSNITDDTGNNLTLAISQIRLNDLKIVVENPIKEIRSVTFIQTARVSGEIAGSDIGLRTEATLDMQEIILDGISIGHPVEVSLSLDMHKSDSIIMLREGSVTLEKMLFETSGTYSPITGETNLSLLSSNADIKTLTGFIPERILSFSALNPSGKISAGCLIEGIYSRESRLHYRINFLAENISFTIPEKELSLSGSSISGSLTNGVRNNASTSELNINYFNLSTPESHIKGTLNISDFEDPQVVVDLTTDLNMLETASLFTDLPFSGTGGSIRGSLHGSGPLPNLKEFDIKSVLTLNPAGTIYMNSADITVGNYIFTHISGHFMISQDLYIDSLHLSLNGQNMLLNGRIDRFTDLLKGDSDHLHAEGSLIAERIEPSLLPGRERDNKEPRKESALPEKVTANITFAAEELYHRNFMATDITGRVSYYGSQTTIENFSARSMGGAVEGSLLVVPLEEGGFLTDSKLEFSDINIKSAFTSFEEFGQKFISSDNLKGTITGTYNMLMFLNQEVKPDPYTISSDGRFVITDGELIGFQPIMALSRFIEISELQHIRFSRLENEFYIRDGTFSIPQMDIKSSAADIGISGAHSFSGNYDYRLRVLLSQILSGKAPRRTTANEFGIIEDDGLGRTSVYLHISRIDGKENIAYDVAAAGTQIKESLNRERETLRGILREEYGIKRIDTVAPPADREKIRPRFRIIWDETLTPPDTIKKDTTKREQKNSTIRNLFNKIIKN